MRNIYKSLLVFHLVSGITFSVVAQSKFEKRGDQQSADFSYMAATESYLKALDENSDNELLKLKLARCYHKLNDPQRTVNWYGKCGGEVPTPEEVIEEVRKLVN